ncbi:GNAT family N-acetyltransferase [Lactococcus sp.]|uniref:GNAT family N-acetyltransferase n=1 Tax=Lactococcus sp. TaxID=44273 RepID=UPI0035AF249E
MLELTQRQIEFNELRIQMGLPIDEDMFKRKVPVAFKKQQMTKAEFTTYKIGKINQKAQDFQSFDLLFHQHEGLEAECLIDCEVFILDGQNAVRIAYLKAVYEAVEERIQILILYVCPKWQNQKIGSRLYQQFEHFCLANFRFKSITGDLKYWTNHHERERFYQSLGFDVFSDFDPQTMNKIEKCW